MTDLTIEETAKLLNASLPYVVQILDEGQLRSHLVGTQRRVLRQDVLTYRNEHYHERKAILDEMVAIDQELGLI